jgi:putative hemolysin
MLIMRQEPIRSVPFSSLSSGAYTACLAQGRNEVRAAQELRYRVFNHELGQGLSRADELELDADSFDAVCDHLVVEDAPSGSIIGTYRMQPGPRAQSQLGFYSASEFDLKPLAGLLKQSVELGRACVDQAHRNWAVLSLLWKGITRYAVQHNARYLFGCSSISSQSAAVGASIYTGLYRKHLVPAPLRTKPQPGYECPLDELSEEVPPVPKLLRSYLSMGAKICGPPAIDREFKTIDFLTLLDLEALPPVVRDRFLSAEPSLPLAAL